MKYIQNGEKISADNTQKRDALEILDAAYAAIDTEKILRKRVSLVDNEICIDDGRFACTNYENIYFIGIGKCAFEGARVLEDILGDTITDGMVLDVKGGVLKRIRSFTGSHPLPSEENVTVTKEVVTFLENVTERDLVLVLISGGGSSLLCLPYGIECTTLIEITDELTRAGADIHEMNTVRKHLSEIQGGQLAEMAFPAEVVSLVFSDVLGDDMSVIASGPTVMDTTTVADARAIIDKYDILSRCSVTDLRFKETPKDDKYFARVRNMIVASNKDALEGSKKRAEELGYATKILTDRISGEAREVGVSLSQTEVERKQCLLVGGETTVTVSGEGKGGRNQELALAALPHLPEGRVLIAAASDGRDNTDVAGAIVSPDLYESSLEKGLDVDEYLSQNNAYEFFRQSGGHIVTGITGSNVSDLIVILDE